VYVNFDSINLSVKGCQEKMTNYNENGVYRTQTGVRSDAQAIDEGLRAYMLRVYNLMALGIAFTALVTLVMMNNPAFIGGLAKGGFWIVFIAILGLGWFAPKLILTGNTMLAHGAYWIYCALWGIGISPMIYKFFAVGQSGLVFQAFAITSVTFGALSLFGYVTKKNLSAFGTFLIMATIGLLIAMVANALFFHSPMMSLIVSCLVVLVFSAITAWETQAIKESYFAGDDQGTMTGKAIFGAFLLFGSFVTLFIHILNILSILSGDD
jgi:FtsH-binding integral membrane protein